MTYYDFEYLIGPIAHRYPPDFKPLKNALADGFNINEYDSMGTYGDDDTLLSCILDSYGYDLPDGKYITDIVSFFLDNGYDVRENNEMHGALCLKELAYSFLSDSYSIEAAKLLLDAGANPAIQVFDDSSATPLSIAIDHDWDNRGTIEYDTEIANYYYALAKLFEYKSEGKDFNGVYAVEDIINKRIDEMYVVNGFESLTGYTGITRELSFGTLFLKCEDMIVSIDSSIGILVENAAIENYNDNIICCPEVLGNKQGKRISKVEYEYESVPDYSYRKICRCRIILEDGNSISISQDYLKGPDPNDWIAFLE